MTNYLTNALRYAPGDRPITVCVRRRARWVRVSVCDEGPGMPRSQRRHIWERFQRAVDPADKAASGAPVAAASPGLGPGLHICKTIVELHAGQVGLQSKSGSGATFWFEPPLQRAAGDAS